MASTSAYFVQKHLVKNKFTFFIGVLGIIVLLLHCGDASPSALRHKGGKSANQVSRTSRSTNNPGDKVVDFNSTLDANDGKLCSLAGGSDRPACRKIGLDMKQLSLELIKRDILKKLRLDENKLPNSTVKGFPIPPQYLSEIVDIQGDSPVRDESYDDEHATTEKIIAFSKPEQNGSPTKTLHHFSFSEKMANMRIESATMYVHVRYNQNHHGQGDKKIPNYSIRIRQRVQGKEGESPIEVDYGTFKPMHHQSTNLAPVRHSKSKWVQIDIKEALTKWLIGSIPPTSRKITLAIDAVDSNGNPFREVTVVSSSESDVNTQYSFIEVHVSENGRSRQTRNIGMTCDENSKETRCCKYPLTVDFEEFGWDWIIAPKKYDANYCSGECPFAFLQKYPHNHIVQQAVPSGVGGPCCAARKMSSISMLYFDGDGNIVYSVLPGMVVEKCGCA